MAVYTVPADGIGIAEYVNKPCQAHCLIKEVEENPLKATGELMNAIRVKGKILRANDETQNGREFSAILNNPNMSHKDGGAYAAKIHLRLAAALRLLGPIAPGASVEIPWPAARGRQCVIFFADSKDNEGNIRTQVSGAHFYDVADSEVAHVPKDQAALTQMGSVAGQLGGGNVQQSRPAQQYQPQPQQAAPSQTSWDNI